MRDDFLSGDWADNHHRFTTGIDKLMRRIWRGLLDAFEALTRQQFDAPWQRRCGSVKTEKA